MSTPLQSFLPYHVARDLLEHPGESPLTREQRFDAVALFADVSGFTALSESLGALGREGTEQLTHILNRYFGTMITLLHAYGGIIGKFGGDSMTVLFPCSNGESCGTVAHRAVQCALEMQLHMKEYERIETSGGIHSIRMKSGLAAGAVFCTSVGVPDIRLEHIIAGAVLDDSADAEHRAQSGQTVIHRHLAEIAPEILARPLTDNFCLVEGVRTRCDPDPLETLPPFSPQVAEIAVQYVHPSIAKRIQREQFGFINEHRKVTTVFVRFTRFDERDPNVRGTLQTYLAEVIRIIARYGGSLNKVDMGDKGSKFIVLFGAPIAHEDDAERALRCALDLRSLPGPSVRIGVSTGFVFSGQVGSADRREYTVMGDAVNLAARLMQAAKDGQILVNRETYKEAAPRFDWGEMRPLAFKGKTRPEQVRPLQGLRTYSKLRLLETHYALPLVGRQPELQTAAQCIRAALNGNGQVLGITGAPGMGKTRLAAEIIRKAMEAGMTGLGGECLSHGTQSAYLVWRNILRALLGVDALQPAEHQIRALETALARISPLFPRRAPLLGPVLGLLIPENDLTRSLDPKLRKELLETLVVDCIRAGADKTPLLIVLEDRHWIDPLSADLLALVERRTDDLPVLILEIYRPPEDTPGVVEVAHPPRFREIRLPEFTEDEAGLLILSKLARLYGAQISVSEALVARIAAQAQGNPFYIDEIINYLHARGLELADLYTLGNFDLPGSLHSLILSRIDQLTESAKTTLKVASVVGRTFKVPWLWGIYPKLGTPQRVLEQLDELQKLDVAPIESPEPEQEYFFRHILTRDVAYKSLAIETRTHLHELLGNYIESRYPNRIPQFLDLLAYHYAMSENTKKQAEYFLKAGEAAQQRYDNQVALQYYRRLLPLLDEPEQPSVLLKISQVLSLVGEWEEAAEVARRALEIASKTGNMPEQARSQLSIGTIFRMQGRFDDAISHLQAARQFFEQSKDFEGLNDATNALGLVSWNQGDLTAALSLFQECKAISTQIDSAYGIYRAASNIGLVYWYQGNHKKAIQAFTEGQQVAQSIDDRLGVSRIANNIGNIFLDEGRYAEAFVPYLQFLTTSIEIGYREGISIAAGNLGNVYVEQGEYDHALACFTYNLKIANEMGDPVGEAMSLWYLGYTFIQLGQLGRAGRVLETAVAIAREVDIPYELSDFLYTHADCLTRQHEYAAAARNAREALELAREVENSITAFRSQVLIFQLDYYLEHISLPPLISKFETLLQTYADDSQGDRERAAAYYAIWQLDAQQDSYRQKAAAIYRKLYEGSPKLQYKRRYEKLTGETLPAPPPLPSLPEAIADASVTLDHLLKKFDS